MSSAKNIILIGGGGHCRACIDVVELSGIFKIAGILDTAENIGKEISGYKVIGTDKDFEELIDRGYAFHIAIGSLDKMELRKDIFVSLKKMGGTLPPIISPRAYVSKTAQLGEGTMVMHHAFVNAFATVGENTILNSGSAIEHDVRIGNHCHVSTHSIVNGGSIVGDEVFVGSGAVLINGITVEQGSVIGAGTVVHKSIAIPGTYVGNPFRKIA